MTLAVCGPDSRSYLAGAHVTDPEAFIARA
jgi:hypothetical protein